MRNSVLGSSLVHLAVVASLFVMRPPAPMIVPGPDVVQVALMDAVAPTAVAEPAEPRKPEPEPAVQPSEEEGVKLTPDKPKKPEPTPRKERSPLPANPQLSSEPVGSSGLRGSVAVDARDFEFTYYLILVRNRIAQNWTPPAGLTSGGQPIRCVVYFRIGRGGDVTATRLESQSPVEFFDRSALRAVTLSDPMPPLPLGYSGSDLGVHFGFEYAQP